VLDYSVTSNHVHLLLKDSGEDVIAQSMQLIAGRTAEETLMKSRPVSTLYAYARARVLAVLGLTIVGVVMLTGCRATTQNAVTYAYHLPRPERVIVHDFTVKPGETNLGSGLIDRLKQRAQGTDVPEQEIQLQQKITRTMTTQLVQEIRKLGLPVESAATTGPVAGPTLDIEGQFLSIDEGNRTRRLVIGFGAGASHVRVAVQVFETVEGQHRLVEDFYASAASSRKPGLGPMAGVGAARGAAAASAGVGIGTTALAGQQDAESDTKQAAIAITRELARFFLKQGWITAEQAESYHSLLP
jgi:hypothetical protein